MVNLPRLTIAATATGQGKTTIATGLMATLSARGHQVSGHKVGPDYIDPSYHALACGRPGRNLDPHLVGEDRIAPLLLHGAQGADIAVIEGVMGLHDGRLGTDGFASTAHVSRLTSSPVVLVADVSRMSRTAAAIISGVATFDPSVEVVGVILNQAGSDRNTAEIERSLDLPVLGALPRDNALTTPSRHLGLVPTVERPGVEAAVAALGDMIAAHVEVERIVDVARQATPLDVLTWQAHDWVQPTSASAVVAVAGGPAFSFCYTETVELLVAAGCQVVTFDPLHDTALPPGTQAIYLGGGFPEVYASRLAANRPLMQQIGAAVAAGAPTVAECAGLLYLAETLDDVPMVQAIPTHAAMRPRLTLRYPVATAASDSLLTRTGEQVSGHEFHRTHTDPIAGDQPAWLIDGQPTGFCSESLHASYLHVHWAGHPQLAQRFADAARLAPSVPVVPASPRPLADPTPVDPLLHHGDVETAPTLVDFAVNVYPEPRPAWLNRALQSSLDQASHYPDTTAAVAALTAHTGRREAEVLATAGAAEAFELVARARAWRQPVVIHPQFTEPHAALLRAGHQVTTVVADRDATFALPSNMIPDTADLVVIGNPTNPTGVLHAGDAIAALTRPGRVVVVDEAFMDGVAAESDSLLRRNITGLVVLRSLTKHWSIPGVRAGYLVGDADVVADLAAMQVPWSVSQAALDAIIACTAPAAVAESTQRADRLSAWREFLATGLRERGIAVVDSQAPFVLVRLGEGVRAALRDQGIAVRRGDTFPGLDESWVRIAARPESVTQSLFAALDRVLGDRP